MDLWVIPKSDISTSRAYFGEDKIGSTKTVVHGYGHVSLARRLGYGILFYSVTLSEQKILERGGRPGSGEFRSTKMLPASVPLQVEA